MASRKKLKDILTKIALKGKNSCSSFMNHSVASSLYIHSNFIDNSTPTQDLISLDDLIKQQESDHVASRVILGDSGQGKTSMGLYICQEFWKRIGTDVYKLLTDESRIPIYIHLPAMDPKKLDKLLQSYLDCSDSDLDVLYTRKLLIILDGFDELSITDRKNIYKSNSWGGSAQRDVKVLYLSQNVISNNDKIIFFQPLQVGKSQEISTAFKTFTIQPFDQTQIYDYINKFDDFITSHTSKELDGSPWEIAKNEYDKNWTKAKYLDWFKDLPNLSSLSTSPIILSFILQILPVVVNSTEVTNSRTLKERVSHFCNTKVGIYDRFIDELIFYAYKRLMKGPRFVVLFEKISLDAFKIYCYAFAQNLAYSCLNTNFRDESCGLLLQDKVIQASEVQDVKLLELIKEHSIYLKETSSSSGIKKISLSDEEKVLLDTLFNENPELMSAVLNACLIKPIVGGGKDGKVLSYQFIHKSIPEYFVARDIFINLQGHFMYYISKSNEGINDDDDVEKRAELGSLNKYILNERQILLNLAERVNDSREAENNYPFKTLLFQIIHKSKESSVIAIMSANSISILNLAGIPFTDQDFSWAQFHGANLNGSICTGTDFRGANLTKASFENAWLAGAQFQGANLTQTNFGLSHAIKNVEGCLGSDNNKDNIVYALKYHENHLYVCFESSKEQPPDNTIKLIKWNILKGKKITEFSIKKSSNIFEFENNGFSIVNGQFLVFWGIDVIFFELQGDNNKVGQFQSPIISVESTKLKNKWDGNDIHQIKFISSSDKESKQECQMIIRRANTIHIYQLNLTQFTYELKFTYESPQPMESFKYMEKGKNLELLLFIEDVRQLCIIQPKPSNIGIGEIREYEVLNTIQTNDKLEFKYAIDSSKAQLAIGWNEGYLHIVDILCDPAAVVHVKHDLTEPCDMITTLEFSANFETLVSGHHDLKTDNEIKIWDTSTYKLTQRIPIGKKLLVGLTFVNMRESPAPPPSFLVAALRINDTDNKSILSSYTLTKHDEGIELIPKVTELTQLIVSAKISLDGQVVATELIENSRQVNRFKDMTHRRRKSELIQIWATGTNQKLYSFSLDHSLDLIYYSFLAHKNLMMIQGKFLPDDAGFSEHSTLYDSIGDWFVDTPFMPHALVTPETHDFHYANNSGSRQVSPSGNMFARGIVHGSIKIFNILYNNDTNRAVSFNFVRQLEPGPKVRPQTYCYPQYISFHSDSESSTIAASYNVETEVEKLPRFVIYLWDLLQNGSIIAEFELSTICLQNIRLLGGGTNLVLLGKSYNSITRINFSPSVINNNIFQGELDEDLQLNGLRVNPQVVTTYALTTDNNIYDFDYVYEPNLNIFATKCGKTFQLFKCNERAPASYELIIDVEFWFTINQILFLKVDKAMELIQLILVGSCNLTYLQCNVSQKSFTLIWSHTKNITSNVTSCNIHHAIGLDQSNYAQLILNGGIGGQPSRSQLYISKTNVKIPLLGSSVLPKDSVLDPIIKSRKSNSKEPMNVYESNWIISAIGKRSRSRMNPLEQHIFLTIEGIEGCRRFLTEAHLRYNKEEKKTFFILKPIIDFNKFRKDHSDCKIKQWQVGKSKCNQLIQNILKDYQRSFKYNYTRKNCIWWSRRHLKRIGFKFKNRFTSLFAITPSDIWRGEGHLST